VLLRTSCGVFDLSMLFCRPTAAHLAPFILQSLGRWSPPRRSCATLRQTAIRQKLRSSILAADRVQVHCSRYANYLVGRTCVVCRPVDRSLDAGAAAVVPVVCGPGAGRRRADDPQSGVVMSSVVDSARERGRGNIDANDPKRALDTISTHSFVAGEQDRWRDRQVERLRPALTLSDAALRRRSRACPSW
jgi:hypothetical protein